jgi:uncharacterized membrane protein
MEWLPTLLSALIAPVALYMQQRQQNHRESERELREEQRRNSEGQAARVAAQVEGRRDAYVRLAHAAYAYRQERATQMLKVFRADSEMRNS